MTTRPSSGKAGNSIDDIWDETFYVEKHNARYKVFSSKHYLVTSGVPAAGMVVTLQEVETYFRAADLKWRWRKASKTKPRPFSIVSVETMHKTKRVLVGTWVR